MSPQNIIASDANNERIGNVITALNSAVDKEEAIENLQFESKEVFAKTIILAIEAGYDEVAAMLRERNDPRLDHDGEELITTAITELQSAITSGQTEITKRLRKFLNEQLLYDNDATALMSATDSNDTDRVELLIKLGIDPNIVIEIYNNQTALDRAISNNSTKLVILLLKSEKVTSTTVENALASASPELVKTALMLAVENNNPRAVAHLLKSEKIDSATAIEALKIAATTGKDDVVKAILFAVPKISFGDAKNAIETAAADNSAKFLKLLYGSNIAYHELQNAAKTGNTTQVRELLRLGVDPDINILYDDYLQQLDLAFLDRDEQTALEVAADPEVIREILASTKITSLSAQAAFMNAIDTHNLEVIKAFLTSEKISIDINVLKKLESLNYIYNIIKQAIIKHALESNSIIRHPEIAEYIFASGNLRAQISHNMAVSLLNRVAKEGSDELITAIIESKELKLDNIIAAAKIAAENNNTATSSVLNTSLSKAFQSAIMHNDTDVVNKIINSKIALDVSGIDISKVNNLEMATLLVESQKFSSAQLGKTLETASANGNIDLVRIFLKSKQIHSANISAAIEKAAENRHLDIVKELLISEKITPEDRIQAIRTANQNGHLTAQTGGWGFLRKIFSWSSTITGAIDKHINTRLEKALVDIKNDHKDLASCLADLGINVTKEVIISRTISRPNPLSDKFLATHRTAFVSSSPATTAKKSDDIIIESPSDDHRTHLTR